MSDYKVVLQVNIVEFQSEVNRYLSQGYDLIGGVSVCLDKTGQNTYVFFQAVAKNDRDDADVIDLDQRSNFI